MSSNNHPNGLSVRKPNFGGLPKLPVAGSSLAYRGGRIGLIDELDPKGTCAFAVPGWLSPTDKFLTYEFLEKIEFEYIRLDRDRLAFLDRRVEFDRLYAGDVLTHARKHAKNGYRLVETIQRMLILEALPRDWIKLDLGSLVPMPNCVFEFLEGL